MSDIRIKMAKDLRDMSDMVGDLHWMAAKAVEDLTKKDGEIAKRDEELAACRVAVENCEVFRARIAELEQDLAYFPSTVRSLAETVTEREAEINQLRAMLSAAPAAPAADAPPENCRQRLAAEGKPYHRSSCTVCGKFSPKWRECDAALAAHSAKGVV